MLDRNQDKPLPDYTDDLLKLTEDFNTYFINKIDKIRNSIPSNSEYNPPNDFPQMKMMHEFQPTCLDEVKEIIAEVGIKCSPADLLPQKLYRDNIDILLPIIVHLLIYLSQLVM